MYRIGICDDDLAFGSVLEQYLQNFAKRHQLGLDVFLFKGGEEYLKFLAEEAPVDLLFLDIEFEDGMDGSAVGKELRADLKNEITQIVYISGLESYAMQLFQNRPMDFLIKPVKQERVDRIMEEYIRLFGDQKEKYFSYHVGRNRYQILEEEIQYFQCTGRKIQIVTKKGAGDAFYGSMTEVEKLVSVDKFWHIHKSYLVNRNYISSFQPMEVCLTDGTKLPISRNCREEIRQKVLEEMIERRA